jgi:hypothetical protein
MSRICTFISSYILDGPLRVLTIVSQRPPLKKKSVKYVFQKTLVNKHFFFARIVRADDRETWQIHLPAGLVLLATSARSAVSAHCVAIISRIIIMILLYRESSLFYIGPFYL